jgi:murein DD-endopeptidase MepM/ murein hydrolase activator NlpD
MRRLKPSSKVTILWNHRSGRQTRSISVPKRTVLFLSGGFFFFLWSTAQLLSTHSEVFTSWFHHNDVHARLMTEKAASRQLQVKNHALQDRIQQLKDTEHRLRTFLGLARHPGESSLLPQGGDASREPDPQGQERIASLSGGVGGEAHVGGLAEGFREILHHLDKKREDSLTIPMITPVKSEKFWTSSTFGWRKNPFTRRGREFHKGLDFVAAKGTCVIATADGKVSAVGISPKLGNYVLLSHSKRYSTLYGHLDAVIVQEASPVKRRQTIGYIGDTGRSTGRHLHYAVIKDGKAVDPIDYILESFERIPYTAP